MLPNKLYSNCSSNHLFTLFSTLVLAHFALAQSKDFSMQAKP